MLWRGGDVGGSFDAVDEEDGVGGVDVGAEDMTIGIGSDLG